MAAYDADLRIVFVHSFGGLIRPVTSENFGLDDRRGHAERIMCKRCRGLFECRPHFCDGRGLGEPTTPPATPATPNVLRSGSSGTPSTWSAPHKLCVEGTDAWNPRFDLDIVPE
jgi:hypothetical protein